MPSKLKVVLVWQVGENGEWVLGLVSWEFPAMSDSRKPSANICLDCTPFDN